ncbi:MAG: DsbA family protein [Alphaproteobacteria bacterium]|nr:DsbA family protein [Alphaproteobacteria bacterium]
MSQKKLTLDFYHDVVCGWCFNLSPRLRKLQSEYNFEIRHHTFILQEDRNEMIGAFGSMAQAKETILGHWAHCKKAADDPSLVNITGMRKASFEYPYGLPGALACKAAEAQGGQAAHWDIFDAIQSAHMTHARNIADFDVLIDCAKSVGLDVKQFRKDLKDEDTRLQVEADRHKGRMLNVRSVPTVIVEETGHRIVNSPIEMLRKQFDEVLRLAA